MLLGHHDMGRAGWLDLQLHTQSARAAASRLSCAAWRCIWLGAASRLACHALSAVLMLWHAALRAPSMWLA